MSLGYLALILFDLALLWAAAYILTPASRLLRDKLRRLKQSRWPRPHKLATGFTVEDEYPPRPTAL